MRAESNAATITLCNGGEPLAPETLVALYRTAEAARRHYRAKASAARHAEHRRRAERRRMAHVRHIKRARR